MKLSASRVAFGGLVGAVLGIFDVTLFLARTWSELSTQHYGFALLLGALIGLGCGALCAVPLSGIARFVHARVGAPTRRVLASLALVAAFVGVYLDGVLYVHLYTLLHWGLGVVALMLGVFAALLCARELPRGLSRLLVVLALLSPLSPSLLLGGHTTLAQALMEQSTTVGRVVGLTWSAPETTAQDVCQWPARIKPTVAPNRSQASVLVLTIDAWRADIAERHLSKAMPLLAARMTQARYFSRAYTAATRTHESIYSLMTGRWPHDLIFTPAGVDQQDRFLEVDDTFTLKQIQTIPAKDQSPTLAQTLSAAGYDTAAMIAYVFFLRDAGITRGFEDIDDRAYQEANRENNGITSSILTDQSIAWVKERKKPWLAWIHYLDPHAPYKPYGGVPKNAPMKLRYLSELRRVDSEIDRLLQALETMGALKNTWIILAADHGEEFREHNGLFHGTTVYEEQARVPLFVWGPGTTHARFDQPVSLIDLMPTILDLLGIEALGEMDGRSLGHEIRNGTWGGHAERPLLVASGIGEKKTALIDQDTKLIVNLDTGAEQLFNLSTDPRERRNVVHEQPGEAARARCLVKASGVLK